MKIRFVRVVALLAVVVLLSKCSSGVIVTGSVLTHTSKKKPTQESARAEAPGQQKKAAGAQSAKEFAPGQQKKEVSGKSVPPGQAKKKN